MSRSTVNEPERGLSSELLSQLLSAMRRCAGASSPRLFPNSGGGGDAHMLGKQARMMARKGRTWPREGKRGNERTFLLEQPRLKVCNSPVAQPIPCQEPRACLYMPASSHLICLRWVEVRVQKLRVRMNASGTYERALGHKCGSCNRLCYPICT